MNKRSLVMILISFLLVGVLGMLPVTAQDATPEATATPERVDGVFPVTIVHKFGSTTII